jgi:superfamily II DNA/RNA helicase
VGYGHQRSELRKGVDVIAATPGRLLDFMKEGLKLDTIEVLVLDEVDRMLDMGFLPDVKRIILACPDARQTLFFSATVPPEIAAVAAFALRDPVRVEVGINRSAAQTVSHALYPVAQVQKFELLLALLERTDFQSVLIFSRTKHGADRIARRLKAAGHSVAALHSDRSQNQRVEALEGFKNGRYEVMVATDIAARGIDVAGVSHVINYDVPSHAEDYVHRIGRTGRAQSVGDAFTLMSPENEGDVAAIERFIGKRSSASSSKVSTTPPTRCGRRGPNSRAVAAEAASTAVAASSDPTASTAVADPAVSSAATARDRDKASATVPVMAATGNRSRATAAHARPAAAQAHEAALRHRPPRGHRQPAASFHRHRPRLPLAPARPLNDPVPAVATFPAAGIRTDPSVRNANGPLFREGRCLSVLVVCCRKTGGVSRAHSTP